jgi:hypothetical protein
VPLSPDSGVNATKPFYASANDYFSSAQLLKLLVGLGFNLLGQANNGLEVDVGGLLDFILQNIDGCCWSRL